MGNDRQTHPPLINIYMWIMGLNFAFRVFAGGSATRVAARSAGYYFIGNLSAEFIRGSRFPANAGILFAAVGLFLQCPRVETCCICHVLSEAFGEMDMIFLLGSETAGFLERVLYLVV